MENNYTDIDEILKVADRIKSVEPKPFFYSRLRAKLDQRSALNESSGGTIIPIYLKVSGVAIIIINAWFFTYQISVSKTTYTDELTSLYQFNSLNPYTAE